MARMSIRLSLGPGRAGGPLRGWSSNGAQASAGQAFQPEAQWAPRAGPGGPAPTSLVLPRCSLAHTWAFTYLQAVACQVAPPAGGRNSEGGVQRSGCHSPEPSVFTPDTFASAVNVLASLPPFSFSSKPEQSLNTCLCASFSCEHPPGRLQSLWWRPPARLSPCGPRGPDPAVLGHSRGSQRATEVAEQAAISKTDLGCFNQKKQQSWLQRLKQKGKFVEVPGQGGVCPQLGATSCFPLLQGGGWPLVSLPRATTAPGDRPPGRGGERSLCLWFFLSTRRPSARSPSTLTPGNSPSGPTARLASPGWS